MKTKTLLELLTLSASLYHLAKDTQLVDRISKLSESSINSINAFSSETMIDEDGNEMELLDKLYHKAGEMRDELEQKVEELVRTFYIKINVAHLDEIKGLNEKLEKADSAIALLEARLNKLELSN